MKQWHEDRCEFEHFDCFARQTNEICRALVDTNFGERDCPFYKSKEQFEKEDNNRKRK